MEAMRKWFCPSCLGAAPLIALIPFLTRVDNPLLLLLSNSGLLEAFKWALGGSVLLACAVLLIASRKDHHLLGNRTFTTGAFLILALSLLSGSLLANVNDGRSLMGLCIAIGAISGCCLVVTLGSWGHAFGLLEPQSILFHSTLTFFAMALFWVLAAHMPTSSTLCMLLALYVVLSLGAYLFYHSRRMSKRFDPAAQMEDVSISRGVSVVRGKAFGFLWVSFFGIIFSFLAAGMTFVPATAGLGAEVSYTSKPLSYGVLAIGVVALFFILRKRNKDVDLDLLYKTILPIAAAILMVFPYVDISFEFPQLLGSIVGILGYLGFALFNVLAWAAAAMVFKVCGASVDRTFLGMFGLCAGVFLLSSELVKFIGQAGQTLDLGILAFYVVLMSISAMRSTRHQTTLATPPVDAIVERCELLTKTAGLSARESEVLRAVSRGRSTNRIAEDLCISPETVRTHLKRIYEKTGVHKREELIDLISGE